MKSGFNTRRYISLQKQNLEKRMKLFSKLYLEIGGRISRDFHTSRILPGYEVDTKLRILKLLGDYEFIYCINAKDIESNKKRKNAQRTPLIDFAVQDLECIIGAGIKKPKIAITFFNNQEKAIAFKEKLEAKSFKVYFLNEITPYVPEKLFSEEGFGKYPLIKTDRNLIVVGSLGGNSGKMGLCISQIYLNSQVNILSGFAKFETLPVWNLSLHHPINMSYEFATVSARDDNLIDPFLLKSQGISAVTYNRDLENYKILKNLFLKIFRRELYSSPTKMGINMIKEGIIDDDLVRKASLDEIKRRFTFYQNRAFSSLKDYINFKRARELVVKYNLEYLFESDQIN